MTERLDELRALGWKRTTFSRSKAKRGNRLPRKHFGRIRNRDVIITQVGSDRSSSVVDLDDCR